MGRNGVGKSGDERLVWAQQFEEMQDARAGCRPSSLAAFSTLSIVARMEANFDNVCTSVPPVSPVLAAGCALTAREGGHRRPDKPLQLPAPGQ